MCSNFLFLLLLLFVGGLMECLLYETERKKRTDCDSRHGCLLRCTVDRRSLYSYDPIRRIWQNHCLSVKGLICISILVCGPSGVGKTTLIKKLMQNYPDRFGFCVSHTTRPKRKGERNGVSLQRKKLLTCRSITTSRRQKSSRKKFNKEILSNTPWFTEISMEPHF